MFTSNTQNPGTISPKPVFSTPPVPSTAAKPDNSKCSIAGPPPLPKYRILSLDGGGIRGLIEAVLLERINKVVPFIDSIDLVAGTSTGGLIALAIAHEVDISVIKNIYLQKGKFIFNDTWYDDVKDLLGLAGAEYDSDGLLRVLREVFGNARMRDLKKHVMVTAFDLDNAPADIDKRSWQPTYFTNFPFTTIDGEPSYDDVADVPVYKAAYYTAAAPTYFPSLDGFIDGGIFASNPSMEALSMAPHGEPVLFSLGTGVSLMHIEGDNLDWGYAKWLKPLFNMMMTGQSLSAHRQCKDLLHDKYFRLAPLFPTGISIDMDDADKLDYMLKFAEEIDITKAVKFLQETWK